MNISGQDISTRTDLGARVPGRGTDALAVQPQSPQRRSLAGLESPSSHALRRQSRDPSVAQALRCIRNVMVRMKSRLGRLSRVRRRRARRLDEGQGGSCAGEGRGGISPKSGRATQFNSVQFPGVERLGEVEGEELDRCGDSLKLDDGDVNGTGSSKRDPNEESTAVVNCKNKKKSE